VTSDSAQSWDVVVVPFPYSERLAEKRRPALIVSDEMLHREGYLWLAMITGAGKAARTGDLLIHDLASAGLPGASMVRTSKLATVEPERILRRIGSLANRERPAIRSAIGDFLAK
jgi:mRNA interferase MazF